MVLFGQIRSIWAKPGCILAKWFYLGKLVLFGQELIVFGQKVVVFELKVVLPGQNGSIWANWFYLGKSGCI